MNSNMNPKRYIGAKYVPSFTELPNNEWQAGYYYERLTIVLYNNNSYTSRKNVPPTVGNPEENKEYWVLTGNYNAKEQQIENRLNTEIENRTNADTDLQNSINEINTNIKNQIERLDSTDMSIQTAINNETTERKNADKMFVTNVSVTNNNGSYYFKQTINGIETDIGSVNVPQNDPVTQISDNIVENNEAGYDSHTLNKTLASGAISNIGTIYIAKKQITDIALDSTGNNLIIKFVDQNGIETEKTISIKEAV